MDALKSLESRIDAAIAESDRTRAQATRHARQRMAEIVQHTDRFNKAAAQVMANVIRPRMELVARKFENATLIDPATSGGHTCSCAFGRTDRFPASTRLDFSVGPDEGIENLLLSYRLEILPVFVAFNGHEQIAFPLANVDEMAAGTWIEARVVDFLKTYMQLETASQYQQENMETDPVCGMPVNRNWAAARMDYRGKTFYFCIEECRRRFAESPERFVRSEPS